MDGYLWGVVGFLTAAALRGIMSLIFQSTLPRGERLIATFLLHVIADFNPRSRVGSDKARK